MKTLEERIDELEAKIGRLEKIVEANEGALYHFMHVASEHGNIHMHRQLVTLFHEWNERIGAAKAHRAK